MKKSQAKSRKFTIIHGFWPFLIIKLRQASVFTQKHDPKIYGYCAFKNLKSPYFCQKWLYTKIRLESRQDFKFTQIFWRGEMIKLLTGLVMIASCHSAFSSNCSVITRDLVDLHFDLQYFGVEVNSVTAHLGSVINGGQIYGRKWENIHDIQLTQTEKQYEARLDTTTYSGAYFPNEGMVVQYFIGLQDGREIITETYSIPVSQGHDLTYPMPSGKACDDYRNLGINGRGSVSDTEMDCLFGDKFQEFKNQENSIKKTQRISVRQVDC